jgi:hypothetical protein
LAPKVNWTSASACHDFNATTKLAKVTTILPSKIKSCRQKAAEQTAIKEHRKSASPTVKLGPVNLANDPYRGGYMFHTFAHLMKLKGRALPISNLP